MRTKKIYKNWKRRHSKSVLTYQKEPKTELEYYARVKIGILYKDEPAAKRT